MKVRRTLLGVLTIAAAILLMGLLVRRADLSITDLSAVLKTAAPWQGAMMLLGLAIPLWLGAEKWRMVVTRIRPPPHPRRIFFLYHSGLAVLVGHVASPFLTGPVVRGLALRRLGPGGFVSGAGSSAFEQAFDAWVTLVFTGTGVACFALAAPAWVAFVALAAAAIAGLWPVALVVRPDRWRKVGPVLPERVARVLGQAEAAGLLQPSLLARLYWLSVLRFWALAPFILAVAFMSGPVPDASVVLYAFAVAQVTRLITITPGNIGIGEWSWALVLTALGWPIEQAALFSISIRVLAIVMMLPIFAVLSIWYHRSDPLSPADE